MLAPRRHVAQRDAAPRESRAHSPRRGGFLLVLGLLLMVVAAGLGWSALSRSGSAAPAGAIGTDLNGNRVALDPGEELTAAQIQAQDAVPDGHGRFQAPSAGLDVALGAMNEVDGVITPPGFSSAYWVRNRGAGPQAPERGTVVVAMHALRGGAVGPGNFLYDPGSGDSRVAGGDGLMVDGIAYTVDSAFSVPKADLPDRADVWADTPNRLVVLTCLQLSAGAPAQDNVVIIAHRHA